jgi:glycosyltransferase involved in cell wall biosynthesis
VSAVKILHVINSLDTGGAEISLLRLLQASDRDAFSPEVISLTNLGPLAPAFDDLAVPLTAVGFRNTRQSVGKLWCLSSLLRRARPDVVQTWMYHASALAWAAGARGGRLPVVWCVRQADLDQRLGFRTRLLAHLCGRLSRRVPARIVYNAAASREVHSVAGWDDSRASVVSNGFDTAAFRPDDIARAATRRELGLGSEVPLVGMVARFHPQKDHANFVAAAALVRTMRPGVRFMLCGRGVDASNEELRRLLEAAGIEADALLLGERRDTARLYNACDVVCLSSRGEALPNVLGEAMACGVPCVGTDVGDVARLLSDTGTVVPPRDPAALASALLAVLALEPDRRQALGARARARIERDFGMAAMVGAYETLWRRVARVRRGLTMLV